MKDVPLSTSEKNFVLECVRQNLRLDGRSLDEFRPLRINLSSDWGRVIVSLGETRILAQVSCEVGQPKATRPNEGLVSINVELGCMTAPLFQTARNSELSVKINRTLEKTIKDSGCIDLESLCISAEDKVWVLRVDLSVLNFEGNVIDCASIAALTALSHFKRPDVTIEGEEVIIHTHAEKDPIPIVLHHYPICISFATFRNGEVAIADPTVIEERCSEANMIFGINSYREVCCINLGGSTLTSTNLLLACSNKAANRAKFVVEEIKSVIQKDAEARNEGKEVGFSLCSGRNQFLTSRHERIPLKVARINQIEISGIGDSKNDNDASMENEESKYNLEDSKAMSRMRLDSSSNSSMDLDANYANYLEKNDETSKPTDKANIVDSDSEEDVVVLDGNKYI